MKEYIENKSTELIIDTTLERKFIECDEYEIKRSIINIMSNAIKNILLLQIIKSLIDV